MPRSFDAKVFTGTGGGSFRFGGWWPVTPGSTPGDCWLVDSVGDFSPTFDRDDGSSFLQGEGGGWGNHT